MSNPHPPYDLAPGAQLLLLGLALALVPLAWVWWRHRRAAPLRRLQALTVLTLYLVFDLVLLGSFTRLSDSGLGCPDWPGCYGSASPLGAQAQIAAAQAAMPSGPVTRSKAWIEMLHRYLAGTVGVLLAVLTAASWWQARRARSACGRPEPAPVSPWWPTLTLLWVCLQGAFGALTVTLKLQPAIVTLHLAGGLLLLALLCLQAVRHAQAGQGRAPLALAPGLRAALLASSLLLALQLLLGGWVSSNYAVLACSGFPACQGSWWPEMDFAQGFQIWRPLGLLHNGKQISFAGLTAIAYTHRQLAWLVLALLALLAWRLRRVLAPQARALGALAALQLASGLSNVVLDWPLAAALLHSGGAAALVLALSWTLAATRTARRPQAPAARSAQSGPSGQQPGAADAPPGPSGAAAARAAGAAA